jgi:hypothetical protein
MGWISDVTDFVEDAVDVIVAPVEAVVEPFVEPFVAPFVETFVAPFVEVVQETVADTTDWFGTAAEDAGDWALTAADEYIFDPVDYVTGGIVDVDYDDGNFSAGVDIGVASVGVSYGEDGFEGGAGFDVGIASAEVAYEDGEFSAAGSYGVNWGPLPYVAGHINIDDQGNVDIGGEAQGTLPTPFGIVTGEVEGGFHRMEDGSWGAYGGAEGTLITPSGVTINAGGNISYEVEADGDEVFNVGGHVGVGLLGGPSVEVGGEYHYIEDDGTVTEGTSGYVEAEGYGLEVRAEGGYEQATDADGTVTESYTGELGASGYGQEISGGASYTETTTADGVSTSSTDAWVDVDGVDTGALLSAAGEYLGDAVGVDVGDVGSVAEAVSGLAGSGDLSEALSTMADTAGGSVAEMAGNLAESGNFDDFSSDVISSEVTEAVADDAWDDLTA